jgi:hypothetical protein
MKIDDTKSHDNPVITDEMIEAGAKEYLRPFANEDDPERVVEAIYLAMFLLRPEFPLRASS